MNDCREYKLFHSREEAIAEMNKFLLSSKTWNDYKITHCLACNHYHIVPVGTELKTLK